MDSILAKYREALRPILHTKVERIILLIWPDENGISETDIRVNFSFKFANDSIESYTFYIDTDGQTPMFKNEKVLEQYNFTDLPKREKVWASPSFWESSENIVHERFSVNAGSKYEGIISTNLDQIEIFCFENTKLLPTGISFSFSNGDKFYCLPGITRGTILDYFPGDWFPETIRKINIDF